MKLELVYSVDGYGAATVLYQLPVATVMLCNKQPQSFSGG